MVRSKLAGGVRKIADETGGGYFELNKTEEFGWGFTRVAQELLSQYLLGFSPKNLDGKIHKLDVKTTGPSQKACAGRSYVASPAKVSAASGK